MSRSGGLCQRSRLTRLRTATGAPWAPRSTATHPSRAPNIARRWAPTARRFPEYKRKRFNSWITSVCATISSMSDLLSIPEAAKELRLDPSRVRALAAHGALPAIKIGNRWAVDRLAVARRLQGAHGAGRPFEPHNAWGVVFLASGSRPGWLGPKALWRLRQALRIDGLRALAPRLERRAERRVFRAHPGELPHLLEDPALARSGISAAGSHNLNLLSGAEADGYVREASLRKLRKVHALEPVPVGSGNVVLRVVPDAAWHLDPHERIAPPAAVALDLLSAADARSRRAGQRLLKSLDSGVGS
jgi:hypothetical protein